MEKDTCKIALIISNVDTSSKQNALLKTKELCRCIVDGETAPNLLMVGGVGTGKTHLANAAVIELTDSGKDCGRVNLIDMVRRLKVYMEQRFRRERGRCS